MKSNRTKSDRCKAIWEKTKGVCAHCGRPASTRERTIDHYIPRSWGSGFDMRNLMPLCKRCNKVRGNRKVDPVTYYVYASNEYIQQCIEYETEFNSQRRSMSGEEY